jgi:hypothetical protein
VRIEVEAYSGFRPDERPLRFRLGEQWLSVVEVMDRWYDPDATYFRVQADDGSVYILKHIDGSDMWTLESFRRA